MKRLVAVMLCCALVTTGCASSGVRVAPADPQPPLTDQQVLSDYLQRLPAGSRIRVERADGTSYRATLMKATADAIVVQKHTRIPEPSVEVPLRQIARVTLDNGGSSVGKAVGIGIAAGVGGFLAVLGILAAIYGD